MSKKRFRICVEGVVQGVGFRPFVYTLAKELNLDGFVYNGDDGVVIEVQGVPAALDEFVGLLTERKPPLSHIERIESCEMEPKNESGFTVKKSLHEKGSSTLIPPDIAMCAECERELFDPANRRFGYAFISCSHCGPRYSVVTALPYDRQNTTMSKFVMCDRCLKEYGDPANRRFHAEPIGCHDCGPKLSLLDGDGEPIKAECVVTAAAKMLLEGKILSVKGIGGFHLICDAINEDAVKLLRERKNRKSKPFALMAPDIDTIGRYAVIDDGERAELLSAKRAIVLLQRRADTADSLLPLASAVAEQNGLLGFFLPYAPLQTLLLKKLNRPLVATSANISGEPIITDGKSIAQKLGSIVDAIVDFDRDIANGCDDSIVRFADEKPIFLRLSRGYSPHFVKLNFQLPQVTLAVGAHQKNTVALGFGDMALLSPHIGDLESIASQERLRRTVETMMGIYGKEPQLVVCDKNTRYGSTVFAESLGVELLRVQHHRAHLLSCLAENGRLNDEFLGVVWDGTGIGDDGSVWGGEFFRYGSMDMERVAHFSPFRLLGGEASIRQPRRSALSLLFEHCGEEALLLDCPTIRAFEPQEARALFGIYKSGINSMYTSSAGRIFDAAASIAGLLQISEYDGQAGLLLESFAKKGVTHIFDGEYDGYELPSASLVSQLLAYEDKAHGVAVLFNTFATIILRQAKKHSLGVALSGGVFQNALLVGKIEALLRKEGIELLTHKKVPPNDAGIAIGQLAFAAMVSRKKEI